MRSLDNGKELWRFDSDYDLEWWPGFESSWPVIADLNEDATPEILIADGTDLGGQRLTGSASLQALDAKTGKPLWDTEHRAKIRSLDRQIQYALPGPDVNGDGLDDVYAVTPMIKSRCWIFVDILSGVTGERLRTVHSEIPVFQSDQLYFAIERPFFLETALDGRGLVIASKAIRTNNSQRHSTVVMSTATGELINIGDQLEHPIVADGDGDGSDDLFLLKPRDRSKPFRSSQLVSLKSSSGGIKFAGESKLTPMDDVDGDGVRDLLDSPVGHYLPGRWPSNEQVRRVVSGANGKVWREWEYRRQANSFYSANGDLDRDGVSDFLAEQHVGDRDETNLVLVSGATGNTLWQQSTRIVLESNDATAQCHDINGDGQEDLLIFRHFAKQNLPIQFGLTCRDGKSGEEFWHFDIAPSDFIAYEFYKPNYESRIVDINGDGYADILCPCFDKPSQPATVAINGKTGKPIWKSPPLFHDRGISAEGWQSEIISSTQSGYPDSSDFASRSVVATAWEGRNSKRKRQLTVDFFDLVSGDLVSTWSVDGKFTKPRLPFGVRSRTERVPLVIADGDQRFAGIMLDTGQKELVVLDFSSYTAKEVRRIASGDLILVEDIDGDGKTEGVFFNQKEFVTIDLVSGKETNRQPLNWAANIQSIRTDLDSPFIRVETEEGSDHRLKLVDPLTLEVQWDMNWPRDTDFGGLLCSGHSSSLPPRVLFTETNGKSSIIAAASAAQFNGSAESFAERFRSQRSNRDHDTASFAVAIDDPRLIEPLPWNRYDTAMGMFEIPGLDRSPVVVITQLLPIVLGAIVFPVAYLYLMFRRRQWSLQWFLLLPLVFVLPYVLLKMPSSLGSEYSMSSLSAWQGKLWSAMILLPFLIFIGVFTKCILYADWKRLFWLTAFSLAIPASMAFDEVTSTQLIEGGHFDWFDPASLWLLWAGVWAGGVGIAILWPLALIWKSMLRVVQSCRTVTEPTEPAVT